MPRVTQAHEQQVRQRIIRAAIGVFDEKGYHRATMQDVVRASGLSVGAIYTYYGGKDELFLASCTASMENGFGELGDRLARGASVADKMAIAMGYFIDSLDPSESDATRSATYLVQAWAEAGQAPTIREMLVRRREQIGTVGQILLREAIARGELPAWIDVEGVALGFSALLDGLVLERIEAGHGWRREDAARRAFAVLELVLAAGGGAVRPTIERPRPTPVRPAHPARGSAELAF